MSMEKLSSNAVNYLIWRYLQEHGYEAAAKALMQSWHLQPETLPFAKNFKADALIHLLQDGLQFDQYLSELRKTDRKYRFGPDHGRKFSVQHGGRPVLAELASPDTTHNNDVPQVNGVASEPRAKRGGRKKKSNGLEPKMNGDAMELEPNGIYPHSRGESEAVMSDVESPAVEEEPLLPTGQIGGDREVQTQKPPEVMNLSDRTQYHKIEGSNVLVKHTAWNPNPQEKDVLIASGQSLLKLLLIESPSTESETTTSIAARDLPLPYNQFDVTAFCWTHSGEAVFATVERSLNEKGDVMETCRVDAVDANMAPRTKLNISGAVFQLRWNASSRMLLIVSGDDKNGTVRVWNSLTMAQPLAFTVDKTLCDAQWTDDSRFVACGDGFLGEFEANAQVGEIKLLQKFDMEHMWDAVSYNRNQHTAALKSIEGEELATVNLTTRAVEKANFVMAPITAIEYRSLQSPSTPGFGFDEPLATASYDGHVQFWNTADGLRESLRIEFEGRPVHAIAFSPDGSQIAAAGVDRVLVWDTEKGGSPTARWEGTAENWNIQERDAKQEELPHRLQWDASGERLAFIMGNQLAIITVAS